MGRRAEALLVALAAIVVGMQTVWLAVASLRFEGSFRPDSAFYIDGATNLVAGRGLANSMAILNEAIEADRALPIPMTQWAPGYSVAIASIAQITGNSAMAALLVAAMGYGAVLLVALVWLRSQFGYGAAIFAAGLVMYFQPLEAAATTALTETMGFALLMAALAVACRRSGGWRDTAFACVAGVFAGLAFATRYALAPVIVIVLLAAIPDRTRAERLRGVLATLTGFGAVFVPIVVRNLIYSGHLRGAMPVPSNYDLAEVLGQLLVVFRVSWRLEQHLVGIFLQITMAAIALRLVWLARGKRLGPHIKEFLGQPLHWILPSWAFLYLAFIVYSELRMAIDPLDTRLALPATAALGLFAAAALGSLALGRSAQWIGAVLGLCLAVTATFQSAHAAQRSAHSKLRPVYDFSGWRAREASLTWIAENTTERDFIIGEENIHLAIVVGGRDFLFTQVAYPETYGVTWQQLEEYVDNRLGAYDRVYFVFGKQVERQAGMRPGDGTFLDAFFPSSPDRPARIRVAADVEDAIVFEILNP